MTQASRMCSKEGRKPSLMLALLCQSTIRSSTCRRLAVLKAVTPLGRSYARRLRSCYAVPTCASIHNASVSTARDTAQYIWAASDLGTAGRLFLPRPSFSNISAGV